MPQSTGLKENNLLQFTGQKFYLKCMSGGAFSHTTGVLCQHWIVAAWFSQSCQLFIHRTKAVSILLHVISQPPPSTGQQVWTGHSSSTAQVLLIMTTYPILKVWHKKKKSKKLPLPKVFRQVKYSKVSSFDINLIINKTVYICQCNYIYTHYTSEFLQINWWWHLHDLVGEGHLKAHEITSNYPQHKKIKTLF